MLNKILLIGNLGKDLELNVTPDGTPVTKFSLAVNRRYKGANGEQKEIIASSRQSTQRCVRYAYVYT